VRSGLVVAQVALALVLLVGSGLMARSFVALRHVDLGFEREGLLTFRVAIPRAEYAEPSSVVDFDRRLTERLAGLPGVLSVGMTSGLPLTDMKSAGPMEPVDQPVPEGDLAPIVERRSVTPGYLEAMGVPLLEGRALEWSDQADQARGVLINRSLASAFWPGESPVGRRLREQGSDFSWEVVGVTGDVRFEDAADEPLPLAYFPVLQGAPDEAVAVYGMDVAVRVAGEPLAAVAAARGALRDVDPQMPMINPRSVESVVDDSMLSTSFAVLLLGIAAAIALLLGTVGLYGVISYVVSRKTQEIGVRMALGAPAATVLGSVLRDGMVLTGFGLALGLAAAWAASRALASLLYGVSASDPVTFVATPLLLALVALVATWLPARRAARVDPVRAMRSD
jgi:predicted permease